MACGYGLPPDTKFEVGQVYDKPIGDDFSPHAIVAVLPWQGDDAALLIHHARDWPVPACPDLTTASYARDWWRPWTTALPGTRAGEQS